MKDTCSVISTTGLPTVQFLIACSMQTKTGRWEGLGTQFIHVHQILLIKSKGYQITGDSRSFHEELLRNLTLLPRPQVNHFPGTFQIGRKDRLWRNLSKMQARVGKKARNYFLVLVPSVASTWAITTALF